MTICEILQKNESKSVLIHLVSASFVSKMLIKSEYICWDSPIQLSEMTKQFLLQTSYTKI